MFDNGVSEAGHFTSSPTSLQSSDKSADVTILGGRQRTLGHSVACTGIGLHSGTEVRMVLRPAPVDSGICFRRVDLDSASIIPARWHNVSDTRLNTAISNGDGVVVATIEHLMAALAGMSIDNVLIDIDGPEVPVMDGSSAPFVFLLECAGTVELAAPRRAIKILKPVVVQDGAKRASLSPADDFLVGIEIDFAVGAIGHQRFVQTVTSAGFKAEISRARTFGFEKEVAALRAAGLARGGSLDNAVVVSNDGTHVLNSEGLRFEDEFVRHKVLDAIGDLALAGAPILGHFHGVRTGHALNSKLLHAVFADESAWRMVTIQASRPAHPQTFFSARQASAAVA